MRRWLFLLLLVAAGTGCRGLDCCPAECCPAECVHCPPGRCQCHPDGRPVGHHHGGLFAKKPLQPPLPPPPPNPPVPKFHPVPVKPVFE